MLYHACQLEERPETVRPLLKAVSEITHNPTLLSFDGMLSRSDKFTGEKLLTSENLEQLIVDLRGGVFSFVNFYERRQDERKRGEPGLSATLAMIGSDPRKVTRFPFALSISLPISDIVSSGVLARAVISLGVLLDSPYGFVHATSTWRELASELSGVPEGPMIVPGRPVMLKHTDPKAREQYDRLLFYQRVRHELGQKTRRAYLGNLLGKELVDRLGGIESVAKSAPAEIRIQTPLGGIYLQAFEEIKVPETPAELSKLTALDAYLGPVQVHTN